MYARGPAYSMGHWTGKTETTKTRSVLPFFARSRRPAHMTISTNHKLMYLRRARASPHIQETLNFTTPRKYCITILVSLYH